MSTDIATLGIRVDALEAKIASKTLDELALSGNKAEKSTTALTTATAVLSKVYGDLAKAAVAWKAYDYIKDATLLNARYETLGISMVQVGKNVGYTADQMEAAAKALQKTGISMSESRSSAMQLVQAHIDLADSTKLARVAQDAAVVGGINSSEAFGRLVLGIQSAQVEILRTMGINVSFEQGYEKTAAALHKTAAQLTENEKAQSRLNQVMEKGKDISGVYEASMSTAGKQMTSMKRYTEDLKVKVGEVFNETLTVGVMAFTDQMKNLNGEMDSVAASGQLNDWAEGVTNLFVTIADNANNLVGALKVIGYTIAALAAASNLEIWDSAGRSAIKEQYDKDVDAVYAGEDRFGKALEKRRAARSEDAAKLAAGEAKKLEQTRSDLSAYARALEDGLLTQQQYATATTAIMKGAYGDNHSYQDTPTVKKEPKGKAGAYDGLNESIQKELELANQELEMTTKLGAADRQRATDMDKVTNAYVNGKITQVQWVKLAEDVEMAAAARRDATSHSYLLSLQEEGAKLGLTTEQTKMVDAAKQAAANPKYAEQIMAEALAYAKLADAEAESASVKARMAAEGNAMVASGKTHLSTLDQEIEKQKESNAAIGLSSEQVTALAVKKLELSAASEAELATNMKLAAGLAGPLKDAYEDYATALEKSAAKKRELAGLQIVGAAELASVNSFKGIWQSVDQTAHSVFVNIFNGGQDAFTKLTNVLRSTLLDLLYQMTVKKWIFDITASVTGTGSNVAGAIGMVANAGNAAGPASGLSSAGSLSNLGTFFSNMFPAASSAIGSFGTAVLASAQSMIGMTGTTAQMVTSLTQAGYAGTTALSGMASSFASAIPYAGVALLALNALGAFSGPTFKDAGGAIYANVGSGGASSVANVKYTEESGRGGTTINGEWSEAGAEATKYIDEGVKAVTAANRAYAEMLGLDAKALDNYTAQLVINTTGLDAAAAKTAVDTALIKFSGDQATSAYGAAIAEFAREGENASLTMNRLATDLMTVNQWASLFGTSLIDVSVKGAGAAATLIDAFGGLDKFNSSMSSFYKNYYTQAELDANTYAAIQSDLAKQGIDVSIEDLKAATKDGVRAWVEVARQMVAAGTMTAEQFAHIVSNANQLAPLLNQAPTLAQQDAAYEQARHEWAVAHPWEDAAGSYLNKDGTVTQGPLMLQGSDPHTASASIGGAGSAGGDSGWQDTIKNWLAKMDSTNDGVANVQAQTIAAWASYSAQLALAKGGDDTARGAITGYADTYITALKNTSKTMIEEQIAIAKVREQLGGLINDKTPTQTVVDAIKKSGDDIVRAIQSNEGSLGGGSSGALREGGNSPMDSSGGSNPVAQAVDRMNERLERIEHHTLTTAMASQSSAQTLDQAAGGGRPLTTLAVT